ncbi:MULTISPECIES: methionyl-tRNA formyltransferase [unclassified Streptomyces]|uniref:methionyl-tRNA formyltransferase n=1 Tax=unclassified Streptomyces TaxID=2593676 RepID=UPI002E295F19|nr:formyltransferase family protein [Streptomyces sp. NBC_00223]
MPQALRIGVISSGPAEFATIHAACTDAGHLPVAYFYGRSLRSGGPNLSDAPETTAEILDAVPPGMDLLLPGSMDGLAGALESYHLDLVIVFGFAWKIPRAVLAIPRLGMMNIHVSMLPKYRGPAPMLWAIRNGDTTGGVTVHWMDEEFDTGNILAQRDGIPLADDITWKNYCDDALPVIHDLLRKSLDLAADGYAGETQDADAATYAGFMEDDFSVVNWSDSARDIHNQVRTHRYMRSTTHPLARVEGGEWLHIIRTSLEAADGPRIVCGDGRPLWLLESEPGQPPAYEDSTR